MSLSLSFALRLTVASFFIFVCVYCCCCCCFFCIFTFYKIIAHEFAITWDWLLFIYFIVVAVVSMAVDISVLFFHSFGFISIATAWIWIPLPFFVLRAVRFALHTSHTPHGCTIHNATDAKTWTEFTNAKCAMAMFINIHERSHTHYDAHMRTDTHHHTQQVHTCKQARRPKCICNCSRPRIFHTNTIAYTENMQTHMHIPHRRTHIHCIHSALNTMKIETENRIATKQSVQHFNISTFHIEFTMRFYLLQPAFTALILSIWRRHKNSNEEMRES